jgi:ribose transport system ATP-binding protein
MNWSIGRNMTLVVLDKLLGRHRLIDKELVSTTTRQYLRQLSISAEDQDQVVSNLSGGNQQKVVLGKWLASAPTILLLNNPTRGVDVGAKWEIYEICQKLAAEGMTILMTSGEVEEILGLSDRVFVLSKGKLLREFQRGQVTKAELLHAMSGQHQDAVPK